MGQTIEVYGAEHVGIASKCSGSINANPVQRCAICRPFSGCAHYPWHIEREVHKPPWLHQQCQSSSSLTSAEALEGAKERGQLKGLVRYNHGVLFVRPVSGFVQYLPGSESSRASNWLRLGGGPRELEKRRERSRALAFDTTTANNCLRRTGHPSLSLSLCLSTERQ